MLPLLHVSLQSLWFLKNQLFHLYTLHVFIFRISSDLLWINPSAGISLFLGCILPSMLSLQRGALLFPPITPFMHFHLSLPLSIFFFLHPHPHFLLQMLAVLIKLFVSVIFLVLIYFKISLNISFLGSMSAD